MTIGVIIQARMGSTRLPGKVLMQLDDQNTVLDFLLQQLKHCRCVDKIIVATTNLKEDDVIENMLKKQNMICFRGNPTDVLDRYYQCAKLHSLDTIIRITGDCPLVDPILVDEIVTMFKSNMYDYISNAVIRSFPYGLDTEIISFNTLEIAWKSAKKDYEREHVTPYIYDNPKLFKIFHYKNRKNLSSFRCTVDEIADLILIRNITSKIQKRPILMNDFVDLLIREPNLININKNVNHKHILKK